jgi:hypothetical protein
MPLAKLLSDATNYAVVQLPGRQFPEVVFQGDSLNNIIGLVAALQTGDDDPTDLVDELLAILKAAQDRYEAVCEKNNIDLPYMKL